jgi:gamma-glutamyltranspeptidase/glutathione hydrolase
MTPQEAIEAPRFRSYPGLDVAIEAWIPSEVRRELERRGHALRVISGWTATFGGAQMILVEPDAGTLTVGSDPRREAYGISYLSQARINSSTCAVTADARPEGL